MRREKNQELINRIGKLVKAYETETTCREIDGTVELLKDIAMYLDTEGETLTIHTPISVEIVAGISVAPQFPGISLYYRNIDENAGDRDIALLEWNGISKQLRLIVWDDRYSEDYTKKTFLLNLQSFIPGLTNERYTQMIHCYGNSKTVEEIVETWGVDRCNKGYDIFDFNNSGLLEIDAIVDVMAFCTKEEAVEHAIRDGVKVIPVEELPENFDMKRLGWLDTMENRDAILKYTDKYCEGRQVSHQTEVKNGIGSGKDEDRIPVERQLPEPEEKSCNYSCRPD